MSPYSHYASVMFMLLVANCNAQTSSSFTYGQEQQRYAIQERQQCIVVYPQTIINADLPDTYEMCDTAYKPDYAVKCIVSKIKQEGTRECTELTTIAQKICGKMMNGNPSKKKPELLLER